ncbi:hypothetical protein FM106_00355 [Brachybacterium faecium]|nr:hypothetical protein FM106_00355 [Brachybacterium faecium]
MTRRDQLVVRPPGSTGVQPGRESRQQRDRGQHEQQRAQRARPDHAPQQEGRGGGQEQQHVEGEEPVHALGDLVEQPARSSGRRHRISSGGGAAGHAAFRHSARNFRSLSSASCRNVTCLEGEGAAQSAERYRHRARSSGSLPAWASVTRTLLCIA